MIRVLSSQLEVAGTYTLTSTTANAPSHAPPGDRYTAFTGALLRALDETDPLTLDQIHGVIDRDLTARNLPRPQRRTVNTAGNLVLSRGPTTQFDTEQTDSNAVRFPHTYRSVIRVGLRVFGAVFLLFFLLRYTYYLIFGGMSGDEEGKFFSVVLAPLISTSWPIIIAVITARLYVPGRRHEMSVFEKLVSGEKDVRVRELVVDRSGLTVRATLVRTHFPWRDIAQVGVLQPELESSNQHQPSAQHERKHVLVVRLRPEVPAPSVFSVLSDEHRQLGYLGLCTVEGLGSSRQEIISALERFAGGKLVHSSRQFLDRDPRLRPEIV